MASSTSSFQSPGRRNIRRLLRLRKHTDGSVDQSPLTFTSSSRPPSQAATTDGEKKKSFASQTFLGLGCASSSSSQVCGPVAAAAAVRSSADWHGKRTVRRREKRKKERHSSTHVAPIADVLCNPGIALAAVDDSLDCLVSQRDVVGRRFGRHAERVLRERTYSGRGDNHEQISSLADSFLSFQVSLFGSDFLPPGHYNDMRGYYYRPRVGLQEELLELGERIGHVSTGLREEEISLSIRKVKFAIFDRHFSSETEQKCSICLEEFETNFELGKLGCGHSYHPYCIKKWLLLKNSCPVCKANVNKT